LFRNIVDSVNGSAGITPSDDEGLGGSVDGVENELAGEGFPFSLDGGDVEFSGGNQAVDNGGIANGSGDDDNARGGRVGKGGAGEVGYAGGGVL